MNLRLSQSESEWPWRNSAIKPGWRGSTQYQLDLGPADALYFQSAETAVASMLVLMQEILKFKGLVLQRNKCVPEKQFTAEISQAFHDFFFFNLRKLTGREMFSFPNLPWEQETFTSRLIHYLPVGPESLAPCPLSLLIGINLERLNYYERDNLKNHVFYGSSFLFLCLLCSNPIPSQQAISCLVVYLIHHAKNSHDASLRNL